MEFWAMCISGMGVEGPLCWATYYVPIVDLSLFDHPSPESFFWPWGISYIVHLNVRDVLPVSGLEMPDNHPQPGLLASTACWQRQQCPHQNLLSCATVSLWTQVWALFSSPHGESDFFFALTFCYREFQVRMHTPTHTHTQEKQNRSLMYS